MNATPPPSVAYLGWHGRGNLGDDAIYDAVRSQLQGATFRDLPRVPEEAIIAHVTRLKRSLRHSAQVVGGGTLVGRRHWRRLVKRGLKITSEKGSHAIGIGVQDPVFVGRMADSDKEELKKWSSILPEFRTLSVRGPRSAELLADIGLAVPISGDPALLLPRPDVVAEEGLIGVNLGFGGDLWGHDPEGMAEEVYGAVSHLASKGHRFIGILLNQADRRWTEHALRSVHAEVVYPGDSSEAAAQLARCSLVIVSRLHASILAALSGTPVISLEYQPKCRDFALSIGDEQSLVRTDDLSAADVVNRVEGTLEDSAVIRANKGAAVAVLRTRLEAEYGSLRRQLGLDSVSSAS